MEGKAKPSKASSPLPWCKGREVTIGYIQLTGICDEVRGEGEDRPDMVSPHHVLLTSRNNWWPTYEKQINK